MRFGSKGAADIWCLVKAPIQNWINNFDRHMIEDEDVLVHVEIECKRADGKGRQSEAQKKFQQFCDSQGIPYILVISASELAEKLSAIVLDK